MASTTICVRSLAFALLVLVAAAGPVHAVDGVKLINQSVAVNGTASPGDDPGFPVTISQAGSYRLSGNLKVPHANTTAIEITADDVTLDLNGFAILGPTVCTGSPPSSCTPTGTGDGVFAGGSVENVTVINGTIRGMGSMGVHLLGIANRVERVNATTNGGNGILAAGGSVVVGNTATRNGGNGIAVGPGTVSSNTAIFNGAAGITVAGGGNVIGNVAGGNKGVGLSFSSGVVGYSQNVLVGNNGGGANPQVAGGINGGQNVCGTDAICP